LRLALRNVVISHHSWSPPMEAKCLLKTLSILLSDKWEKPYAVVHGNVNARMSIAIVQATHICLRGSRIPTSKMSNRRPQWEVFFAIQLRLHGSAV
jgi:hypothetical protein